MNPRPKFDQLPRLGTWLLALFAEGEEREQMVGDLSEEYLQRVTQLSPAAARRWYWRQILRSLPHLVGGEFLRSPWKIALAVVIGFEFLRLMRHLPERAIFAFVDQYNLAATHFEFYRFLASTGLDLAHLITYLMVGILAALIARRREMAPALALGAVYAGMTVVASVAFVLRWHELGYLPMRLSWYFSDAFAVVMGAAIVRTFRSNRTRLAPQV